MFRPRRSLYAGRERTGSVGRQLHRLLLQHRGRHLVRVLPPPGVGVGPPTLPENRGASPTALAGSVGDLGYDCLVFRPRRSLYAGRERTGSVGRQLHRLLLQHCGRCLGRVLCQKGVELDRQPLLRESGASPTLVSGGGGGGYGCLVFRPRRSLYAGRERTGSVGRQCHRLLLSAPRPVPGKYRLGCQSSRHV